jgi:hypothetical protein
MGLLIKHRLCSPPRSESNGRSNVPKTNGRIWRILLQNGLCASPNLNPGSPPLGPQQPSGKCCGGRDSSVVFDGGLRGKMKQCSHAKRNQLLPRVSVCKSVQCTAPTFPIKNVEERGLIPGEEREDRGAAPAAVGPPACCCTQRSEREKGSHTRQPRLSSSSFSRLKSQRTKNIFKFPTYQIIKPMRL